MPKIEYPKWLYGPDGKAELVKSPEQHYALGADWYEEPYAKDGTPPVLAPVDPNAIYHGDLTPSTVKAAGPKVEYPKWVYHLDDKAQQVNSEAQHLALGAGWYESPAEATAAARAVAAGSPVPAPAAPGAPVVPEVPSVPPGAPKTDTPLNINELNVAEAALYVDTISALDELARLALAEEQGRNRVTVKKALEARIAVLTAPAKPETPSA